MSSTVIKISKHRNDYEFIVAESHIDLNGFYEPLSKDALSSGTKQSQKSIDFLSDSKKVLLSPIGSFYHFITDHAGSALDLYRQDNSIEFIIDTFMLEGMPGNQGSYLLRSFLKLLAYNGIKYQTFSRPNFDTININNFYIKHYHHQIGDPQTTLFEMYAEYLDLANKKPTRDVYLSRTLSHSPQESDENSLRIDDERALEKYFSSLGFDIIYPEDFRDLDEQICFFHGVRTLVSLTSSGITGATFMQPGQTVIELVTPMVINFPDENNYYESTRIEELHHFYVFMCFRKNHKYMAISNETKNAKKLIKSLESDDIFKAFLNRSRSRRWFKK